MTAIFSSAALKNRQREIKDIAKKELVHITENGNGAYVFCSEELFDRMIEQAREDALYEARLSQALDQADRDIEEGRVYTSVEELHEAVAKKRQHA
jgi:PHD/YefM family antitoxin component YafN of YafNO toxin-antitoxin module